MKEDKYNKILREKLDSNLPKDFDESFWNKFENHFDRKKEKSLFNLSSILVPVTTLSIILTLFIYQNDGPQETTIELANLSQMLQNYDYIEEPELIELTDEDWDILLEKEV